MCGSGRPGVDKLLPEMGWLLNKLVRWSIGERSTLWWILRAVIVLTVVAAFAVGLLLWGAATDNDLTLLAIVLGALCLEILVADLIPWLREKFPAKVDALPRARVVNRAGDRPLPLVIVNPPSRPDRR